MYEFTMGLISLTSEMQATLKETGRDGGSIAYIRKLNITVKTNI